MLTTTIETVNFVIKAMTGLLMVSAAFLVLYMVGTASMPNTEATVDLFQSP